MGRGKKEEEYPEKVGEPFVGTNSAENEKDGGGGGLFSGTEGWEVGGFFARFFAICLKDNLGEKNQFSNTSLFILRWWWTLGRRRRGGRLKLSE